MDGTIFSIQFNEGYIDLNYYILGQKIAYFSHEEYNCQKAYVAYNELGSILTVIFAKHVIQLYFKLDQQ